MSGVLSFFWMLQRSFWRERSAVLWTFFFPLFLLVALGVAFSEAPEPFATIVVDNRDDGAVGSDLLAAIGASGWGVASGAEADARVEIPVETSRRLASTQPARIRVEYRTEDGRRRHAIHGLLSAAVLRLNRRAGHAPLGLDAPSEAKTPAEAPGYAAFLVYGLVGLNVLSTALFGVGVGSSWFREEGVFARLWLTPARPWSYLAAHLMHIGVVVAASTALLLGVGALLFGVSAPRIGSFTVAMLAGSFALIPIGFVIAARAPTPRVTTMWANTLYFPLMLLSGVYFRPGPAAGELLGWTAWFPLAPFLDALRMSSRGGSVAEFGSELAVLMLWGTGACLFSRGIFRWND